MVYRAKTTYNLIAPFPLVPRSEATGAERVKFWSAPFHSLVTRRLSGTVRTNTSFWRSKAVNITLPTTRLDLGAGRPGGPIVCVFDFVLSVSGKQVCLRKGFFLR